MTFSKIFGVAASPLFVHVPAVLIALAGIGAIAIAYPARVYRRGGRLPTVGIAATFSPKRPVPRGSASIASGRRPAPSDGRRRPRRCGR